MVFYNCVCFLLEKSSYNITGEYFLLHFKGLMCDNLCGYKLKKTFFMLLVEILNF